MSGGTRPRRAGPDQGGTLVLLIALVLPLILVLALAAWWIGHWRSGGAPLRRAFESEERDMRRAGEIAERLEPRSSSGGGRGQEDDELALRMHVTRVEIDPDEPLHNRAALRSNDDPLSDTTWLGIGDAFEGVYPAAIVREVGRFTVLLDWRDREYRLLVPEKGVQLVEPASGEEPAVSEAAEPLPEVDPGARQTVVVSADDRAQLEADYERILREDVSFGTYRNPSTRRVEGLRVERLREGSLPARHGFRPGDVIKAIDDFPVRSEAAALEYLRNLQGRGVSVLILRAGRHRRLTFRLE